MHEIKSQAMKRAEVIEALQSVESEYIGLLDDAHAPEKARIIQQLREIYRSSFEQLTHEDRAEYFFGDQVNAIKERCYELVAICVVKDEYHIDLLISKLKASSFDAAIIIDDNSLNKADLRNKADSFTSILEVKQGRFGLAKTLWIESISNLRLNKCWVATLDADEFIELETYYSHSPSIAGVASTRNNLKKRLKASTLPLMPFCLLDVVPAIKHENQNLLIRSGLSYYVMPPDPKELRTYKEQPAVKWSFGSECFSQCMTDVRARLLDIVESRAKFSIIFWDRELCIKLHQGFHEVTFRSENEHYNAKRAIETGASIGTLLHAKVIWSMIDTLNPSKTAEYFPRTAQNIIKLDSNLRHIPWESSSVQANIQPYQGSIFLPSWSKMGKIIVSGANTSVIDVLEKRFSMTYEICIVNSELLEWATDRIRLFKGMRLIRADRIARYIQLINRGDS
jgi:hypothetical protein